MAWDGVMIAATTVAMIVEIAGCLRASSQATRETVVVLSRLVERCRHVDSQNNRRASEGGVEDDARPNRQRLGVTSK